MCEPENKHSISPVLVLGLVIAGAIAGAWQVISMIASTILTVLLGVEVLAIVGIVITGTLAYRNVWGHWPLQRAHRKTTSIPVSERTAIPGRQPLALPAAPVNRLAEPYRGHPVMVKREG